MKIASFLCSKIGIFLVCSSVLGSAWSQTQPVPKPATNAQPPATGGLNIVMKDGKTINSSTLRRSGNAVMATVPIGGGSGEVGYPVAGIARIEFPEPPQIKTATDLLAQGKFPEALALLDPLLNFFSPFRDIPGNFWAPVARLRLNALIKLQRETEAESLIGELSKSTSDPEAARAARVLLAASSARKGEYDKALVVYDDVIAQSTNEDTLALAWVSKGQSLLALKQWEPALLAFLHIPVYYTDQKLQMPVALLGSGKAFMGIEDLPDAEKTFTELIEQFPSSSEAAAAKVELQHLNKESSAKG